MTSNRNFNRTTYDLAIIGGGINGATVARDASLRGLKVILLEKHDFGYGASSKTSKLAHGGLRYLEQWNFKLVRESLTERTLLEKSAPHIVTKLPFILPVYQKGKYPLWKIKLGLMFYDFLSPPKSDKYQSLSCDQILHHFPHLKKEGLKGGCLYYDALMQDNRLVIENVLAAEQMGAEIYNYTPVTGLLKENQKIIGLQTEKGPIYAKVVVSASGPWSDEVWEWEEEPPHLNPSKGIHLILPLIHSTHAMLLTAPQDGRVFFLIPWNGYSLLGTTDTVFQGNLDNLHVEQDEVSYLLKALSYYFPEVDLSPNRIIASFVGVRPLLGNHVKSPYYTTRDYAIVQSTSGLIAIMGGKYTTGRKTAEEVVDKVVERLNLKIKCRTKEVPLFTGDLSESDERIKRLMTHYGNGYRKILDRIKQHPEEAEPLCSHHPHMVAELRYAIEFEKAKTPADWFERRTSIAYTECGGKYCAERTASFFTR